MLQWKKIKPGVYHATSPWGLYTIDGTNAGRNRWTVTYPSNDFGMTDALAEAKAWAALDAQTRSPRSSNVHSTQVANWWTKTAPDVDKVCYPTKTKALKAFLDTNYEIVQNYGGADYGVSPSEFDSINHKYDLRGDNAATTIAKAVWAAMPEGKPFCLDRIDVDALNDTSPARESHLAFRLPDYVHEAGFSAEEEKYHRRQLGHARKCNRCGGRLK
jgi:hypothetical protein